MKAIVYTQYGSADVLRFAEVEKPTPQDNQVLVEVHAVAVNAGDIHLREREAVPGSADGRAGC